MIILDAVVIENKTTGFLIFKNENGNSAAIPVPRHVAELISAQLKYLSTDASPKVERSEDQFI